MHIQKLAEDFKFKVKDYLDVDDADDAKRLVKESEKLLDLAEARDINGCQYKLKDIRSQLGSIGESVMDSGDVSDLKQRCQEMLDDLRNLPNH